MHLYRVILVCCSACVLAGVAVSGVQAGKWTPAAMPQDSDPAWNLDGDPAHTTLVQDEYLHIETSGLGRDTFELLGADAIAAGAGFESADSVGWRARVISVEDDPSVWGASSLAVYPPSQTPDKSSLFVVRLGDGKVGLGHPDPPWVELDTSVWHNYRMDVDGPAETAQLYVDGVLVGDVVGLLGVLPLDTWHGIRWGDQGDPEMGVSDWAYVGWGDDAEPPEPGGIPGDANQDGKVTDADAAILATNWQRMGDATWGMGDFNDDHNVTDADAAILATHWQEGVTGEAAAVPEPGVFVLLAGGLLWMVVRRRRR